MSLNTNALVTYANLDSISGLIPNGAYPYTSDRIATALGVKNYYYVQTSYLSGYANNECPVYQDIVALPSYSITIYARASYSSPAEPVRVKYKIGDNTWVQKTITTIGNPTYSNLGSITVPEGGIIYFGFQNVSNVNVQYGVGNGGGYSGYCGQSASYSTQFYANSSIYLNAQVNSSSPYIYSTC
jgi:hypothetical protein